MKLIFAIHSIVLFIFVKGATNFENLYSDWLNQRNIFTRWRVRHKRHGNRDGHIRKCNLTSSAFQKNIDQYIMWPGTTFDLSKTRFKYTYVYTWLKFQTLIPRERVVRFYRFFHTIIELKIERGTHVWSWNNQKKFEHFWTTFSRIRIFRPFSRGQERGGDSNFFHESLFSAFYLGIVIWAIFIFGQFTPCCCTRSHMKEGTL